MFYQITLFLHSWLRWGVIILLLATLFISLYGWLFKKTFTDGHRKLFALYTRFLGIQVMIGFILYLITSPITTYVLYHNIRDIAANPGITFYTLRHPITMLIAFFICRTGEKRAGKTTAKYKTWFLFTLAVVVILMMNIPWPSMEFGRPLFRF